jgi:mycothiol synthase
MSTDVSDLRPVEIDPRSASREWWERFHAYRRHKQAETRPEDVLMPDAMAEARMQREDAFMFRRYFCMEDKERVWSGWTARAHKPGTPEYEGNKHLLYGDVYVLKAARRQGLGRRWVAVGLELMREYDCSVLTVNSEEEDGHSFLQWLGAQPRLRERENWLDLAEVDWGLVEEWVAQGQARNPATELVFYENRVPVEALAEFCLAFTEISNLVPLEELDAGPEVVTVEVAEDWFSQQALMQGVIHTYLTREKDGSISGLTGVNYLPHEENRVGQGLTGVRTAYRGRGLGKWLKAAMLLEVQKRYPQARWVVTGNANSNEPMLGINHKLGFRLHREVVVYQIDKAKLAAAQ